MMGYINIPDIIKEYYGISDFFISWTALIYTVSIMVLILPLQKYLDTQSVRFLVLVPSGLHVISQSLKYTKK